MQPAKGQIRSIVVFFVLLALIIIFRLSAGISLILGLFIGLLIKNPFPTSTRYVTKYLLQLSIIGLGFGMNFNEVVQAGKDGFVYTLLTIAAAIGLGYVFGRIFKVNVIIAYLISCGTAICGGSAIAAVSQVLKADSRTVSVSIGTVFILNGIALFIFPPIGTFFGLTQEQFGIWAAIAIHDTSSVVGASAKYGNESLMIATTVKLARALWIVPLVMLTSLLFRQKGSPWSMPWFIVFFVLASIASTWFKLPASLIDLFLLSAKMGFSITLFLIGCSISLEDLKKVGVRPFLQGIALWIVILTVSLAILKNTL